MRRDLTQDEKNDLKIAKQIDEMMATAGWKIYSQILAAQLQGKRNDLERLPDEKLDGLAQMMRAESVKGSIIGIRLCLELPSGMLGQAEMIRKSAGITAGEDK